MNLWQSTKKPFLSLTWCLIHWRSAFLSFLNFTSWLSNLTQAFSKFHNKHTSQAILSYNSRSNKNYWRFWRIKSRPRILNIFIWSRHSILFSNIPKIIDSDFIDSWNKAINLQKNSSNPLILISTKKSSNYVNNAYLSTFLRA